jgi:cell wall-associated NlpC family hydrolase
VLARQRAVLAAADDDVLRLAAAQRRRQEAAAARAGPRSFDCSGLTGWAYEHAGISLPRTSRQQWNAGRRVPLGALAPGDLLFWAFDTEDPSTIHHVGIYIGGGEMIHAPHTGDVVRVAGLWMDGYMGAVRPDSSPSKVGPIESRPRRKSAW